MRGQHTSIRQITNVTAFVGEEFEPVLADLSIEGTTITRIDARGRSEPKTTSSRGSPHTIDGTGLMAFPGMIDCHDHLRDLMPGVSLTEGLKLDDYLKAGWEMQRAMGPTEYRLGALLASVQRLKTGITSVCDHCYPFHADGLDEASIQGYEDAGIRWVYARGIMTRPYEPICEHWETAAGNIRDLADSGRVPRERLFVAPVSIRQTAPEEFRRSRELADELGCGLYTHVSETESEREVWLSECGASPIRALDSLGFLTPRTVLVHCVILEEDEIDLLAARGCHVIHCPTNHMKLAKGFTPVPDLLKAGVNVALGVDKMSDLLIEMRSEIGMHAALRRDPQAIGKLDALQMATVRGARALGLGDRLGTIDVGHVADLVLLDARSILHAPLIDPSFALLYTSHPGMVRYVLLGGELVVDEGRLVTVDEEALVNEVEAIAAHYMARLGLEQAPWFRGPGVSLPPSGRQ
jgi:cytosine/adenosine deaminase-related metal-dependent hydrolase